MLSAHLTPLEKYFYRQIMQLETIQDIINDVKNTKNGDTKARDVKCLPHIPTLREYNSKYCSQTF